MVEGPRRGEAAADAVFEPALLGLRLPLPLGPRRGEVCESTIGCGPACFVAAVGPSTGVPAGPMLGVFGAENDAAPPCRRGFFSARSTPAGGPTSDERRD